MQPSLSRYDPNRTSKLFEIVPSARKQLTYDIVQGLQLVQACFWGHVYRLLGPADRTAMADVEGSPPSKRHPENEQITAGQAQQAA